MSKAHNIFLKYFLKHAIKAVEPPASCPIFGVYRWTYLHESNVDISPAKNIVNNFSFSNVNITYIVFTFINNRQVKIMESSELYKVLKLS